MKKKKYDPRDTVELLGFAEDKPLPDIFKGYTVVKATPEYDLLIIRELMDKHTDHVGLNWSMDELTALEQKVREKAIRENNT